MRQQGNAPDDLREGSRELSPQGGRPAPLLLLVAAGVVFLALLSLRSEPAPSGESPATDLRPPPGGPALEGVLPAETSPRPTQDGAGSASEQGERRMAFISGRIRRGADGVADHAIVVRAAPSRSAHIWSLATLDEVASGVSNAQGEFRLSVAPGPYVLQVGPLPRALHLRVSAPTSPPLDIDLGATGRILITVHSPTGGLVAGAVAGVRGADGRTQVALAGKDGVAHLTVLPSGRYIAGAVPPRWQMAFSEDGPVVDLNPSDTENVDLVLSAAALAVDVRPRPMRVLLKGTTDFEGWQARAMYRGTTQWSAVNGETPVRIVRGLDVRAPDGRRWKVRATEEELARGTLTLPTSQVLWRGLLLDRETNEPLMGYTVFARAADSHEAWIGSRTNGSGEFEVRAVQAPEIRLTFYGPGEVKLRGVSFAVSAQDTSNRSHVQVRIPRPRPDGSLDLPVRRMSGTVRQKDGNPPPASGKVESIQCGMISVLVRFDDPDGTLYLGTRSQTTGLGPSGKYGLDVYEAGSYTATVYTDMQEHSRFKRTDRFRWIGFSATRDFELD